MALPDPYADEPTVEIDEDLYLSVQHAKDAVAQWTKELELRQARLREKIGDAHAATVNGIKVYAYRPKKAYAEARIIKDYPDLTEHFFEYSTENRFNMEKFRKAHPEIAEQYRVRALTEVKGT